MNKGEHSFPTSGLRTDSLCVSSTNKHKGNNTITCRKMCRVGKRTSHRKHKRLFNAHNLQLTFNMAYQIITLLYPADGKEADSWLHHAQAGDGARKLPSHAVLAACMARGQCWALAAICEVCSTSTLDTAPAPLLPHSSKMNEGFTNRTEDQLLFLSCF